MVTLAKCIPDKWCFFVRCKCINKTTQFLYYFLFIQYDIHRYDDGKYNIDKPRNEGCRQIINIWEYYFCHSRSITKDILWNNFFNQFRNIRHWQKRIFFLQFSCIMNNVIVTISK